MGGIPANIYDCLKSPIVIYGLGDETSKFISEWKNKISIVGLLDGYLEDGEMFGYPIITMQDVIDGNVPMILVIARPGSCKAIAKRISASCIANHIKLFDIRGNDLLSSNKNHCVIGYDYAKTSAALDEKIEKCDVVSFDLFDTLVMRKVYSYTDVFPLLDIKLRKRGIIIPDFIRLRLFAEKELSRNNAPTLEEIYGRVLSLVGGSFISAEELAELEWQIDFQTMIPRKSMCAKFCDIVSQGKNVAIVTDTYYSKEKIEKLLNRYKLQGYSYLLVSCEEHKSKTTGLYEKLKSKVEGKQVLHVGDDEIADVVEPSKFGITTFRIYSGSDLFDLLCNDNVCFNDDISDHVIAGLFIARLFNNPFQFGYNSFSVDNDRDIGYAFFAPIISEFVFWIKNKIKNEDYTQILFCSRDGYLIGKLYRRIDDVTKSIYFLTSRIAAIRAGIEGETDIASVDRMNFFGNKDKEMFVRFGLSNANISEKNRVETIVNKAKQQRINYCRYADKSGLKNTKTALFDFVAKGTVQLYLQRILGMNFKGFYFIQLEPSSMKNKGVKVEPFYDDAEKDKSVMFDNYYILETIITSPYPQVLEFDKMGNPVFADETRSAENINCISEVQNGIVEFFDDYLDILPGDAETVNKNLGEGLLALINRVRIGSKAFLSLKVEDPFFGRMTDINDVLGS
ncbi:hypothetical protein SAMN04487861_10465 [Selenomonas ruminantium]|uniref:Haloacid dehalogenase-like hydrolase n=1 Tax=Selenomonas ruminantium TaxID=971 RepID=A0A1I3CQG7_SELRU|nr:hypothetical protein [Selenomonas ruminantium]SFH76608.1 hypothetical protein SAMN04487861_10465 [Selenomonas ruminantium]